MKKLLIVMALSLGVAERACAQIEEGDDFEATAASWVGKGYAVGLPYIDGKGLVQLQRTKAYLARTGLLAGHCVDSGGTKLPHRHIMDDYTAANVAAADKFWDKRFDVPNICKKVESAGSTKINCYAYGLKQFIGKGTYNYWLDTKEAEAALNVETEGKPKAQIAANDVLYYKAPPGGWARGCNHVTGIVEVGLGPQKDHWMLQWRYAVSGVYKALD